jgi:hypothetical protein
MQNSAVIMQYFQAAVLGPYVQRQKVPLPYLSGMQDVCITTEDRKLFLQNIC